MVHGRQNVEAEGMRTEEVTLEELLRGAIRTAMMELHTHLPAKVESYDPATQTATVRPELFRFVEGQELHPAAVEDVPVIFPRGGGTVFTFPVEPGDGCLLAYCEKDMSGWLKTGSPGVPPSGRLHDYSDPVAIMGLSARNAINPAPATDGAEIRTEDGATRVKVGSGGIEIDSAAGVEIVAGTGPITMTRGVSELLTLISTALNDIATSNCVNGAPLSKAAAITATKLLIDAMRV